LIVKKSLYNDDPDAKDRLKNCITLDNGSTLSLFSNPDLVQDIQTSSKTLSLATNAGVKQSNHGAIMPGFGKVYYDEDAIANIFGFSDLKKKHIITYDSNKEVAFIVHMDNEKIKFECSPSGLYQYSVSEGYQQGLKEDQKEIGASNLISTVAKNREGYALRQFERAKEARRLYYIVGTSTVNNFNSLLRMNVIQNSPVTVEDVNVSEKIFGPDMSSLKGNDNANEEQLEHPVEQQEAPEQSIRRLTQETRPIERLQPKMSGKSFMQEHKKVNFKSNADLELEYHHNLITQNEPDEGQSLRTTMARLIYDLNTRIVRGGASFAQQYLLNKGLKIFGQKGRDA
jgi:hypothetical protein